MGTASRILLTLVLALAAVAAPGADDAIFTLTDPVGDDHGDGTLLYPANDDFKPGTLDLRSFSAWPVAGGVEFEAVFARAVPKPYRRAVDTGGTQLTTLARHGFYTMNLDVYIDSDRQPGSGRTAMAPGRRAEVATESAWEKAVLLMPRPDTARAQLRRLLDAASKKEYKAAHGRLPDAMAADLEAAVEREVAEAYYFPNIVSVAGPKLRFFVPTAFLGGPVSASWSYVVVVTGADLMPDVNLGVESGLIGDPMNRLMMLPVGPGKSQERFGTSHADHELLPPIVDAFVPAGASQEALLGAAFGEESRPVVLPGVVPAQAAAPAK
jgi:hypothetical protein